ncbi:MAG: tetratricopeptide repeat protein [Bacteroidetes bacterium]|nr:tetratricopeptide repeat protein [Bacteroidota bacterium]
MSKKKPTPKNFSAKQAESKKTQPKIFSKKNSSDRQKKWIIIAALAAVTFIIFYPSLKCEFTNWDDGTYVTENPMIWKLDGKALKEIFTTPVSLNYHPLTMLSLAIDYKFDKLNPYHYHLNNVLIHILNVILLFVFTEKFISGYNFRHTSGNELSPFNIALIVSALWAIHPMRVESVTWVAERKDVLYVFFFFLSLIFYLRWLDSKKISAAVFCFLFFICSCLSKGMGVVLPVVLVLIDWFYGETKTIKEFSRSVITKAHFFVAAIVFGFVAFKIQSQGAIAAMETFTLFQRLTFACYGFIMYIWKFFLPLNLSAFYPYPFTDAQGNIPAIYYASPFIVLVIAAAIIFLLWKEKNAATPLGIAARVLAFGFSFYFIAVALVLQFISVGSVIMADRYSYLSYVGLLFMVGYFFEVVRNKFSKNISMAATAFLIAAAAWFSFLAHERTKVWTNAKTLWADAMHQFPFIEIAYENRGIYFKDHNQLDSMRIDYEFVTQKLHSKNEKIWSNLGNLYGLLGQQKGKEFFDKSLDAYSHAIEINPKNSSTYLNRAITLSMMGKYAEALPDYDKSIQLADNVALTYKNRAYTLMQLGQFEKSISDYDKALELYSYDTLSYLNRGISKFNAKKFPDALGDFRKYLSLSPNNPQAYYNASVAHENLNQFSEALQSAQMAQKLGQKISPVYLQELEKKAKQK